MSCMFFAGKDERLGIHGLGRRDGKSQNPLRLCQAHKEKGAHHPSLRNRQAIMKMQFSFFRWILPEQNTLVRKKERGTTSANGMWYVDFHH